MSNYSYIKIIDKRVPLDNTYKNVIRFVDIYKDKFSLVKRSITREDFFTHYDEHYNDTTHYTRTNFKRGDGIYTRIILSVRNETTFEGIYFSPNSNYMHVISGDGKDYYYFINSVNYKNGNIIECELELDIWTTYGHKFAPKASNQPIHCDRVHCDRFSYFDDLNTLGCVESYLPDTIDNNFKGNILSNRFQLNVEEDVFALIFFASNTPFWSGTDFSGQPLLRNGDGSQVFGCVRGLTPRPLSNNTGTPLTTDEGTFTLPFKLGIVPIKTKNLVFETPQGNITTNFSLFTEKNFLTNATSVPQTFENFSSWDVIKNSPYVYSIQLISFDIFSSIFKPIISPQDFDVIIPTSFYGDGYVGTIIDEVELTTIGQPKLLCLTPTSLNTTNLTKKVNVSYNSLVSKIVDDIHDRTTIKNITNKSISAEPKLLVPPYCNVSLTSATEEERVILPLLASSKEDKNVRFEFVCSPNPTSNGVMSYVKSGIYQYQRDNYNGTQPITTTEIPLESNTYQEFITTQKNSYYSGLAQTYFNNLFAIGGGITSMGFGSATGNAMLTTGGGLAAGKGTIDSVLTPIKHISKMKDLNNTPNKLASNNFNVYQILTSTDINKYLNFWTLLDIEKEKAFEYFYRYGYAVDKDRVLSYFNYGDSISMIYGYDNNICSRSLFNYIKIDENITNTIINVVDDDEFLFTNIREKINSIYNRGYREWCINYIGEFLNFNLENKEAY